MTTQAVPAIGAAAAARDLVEQLGAEREQFLTVGVPAGVHDLDAERQAKQTAFEAAEADQAAIEERDRLARVNLQATTPRHEMEQILNHWQELERINTALPALRRGGCRCSQRSEGGGS